MIRVAPDDSAIAPGRASQESCEKIGRRLIWFSENFMNRPARKRLRPGQVVEKLQAGFKPDFARGDLLRLKDLKLAAMGGDDLHGIRICSTFVRYSEIRIGWSIDEVLDGFKRG